jgi:hypothetical protein
MLLFSPPLKIVKKEKVKHRISQKTYTTPFYPGDPVAKGETLKKMASGGIALLRSVAPQTGARGYLS